MLSQQDVKTRAKLTQAVRDFFVSNDFLEVETPILNLIPGMEPHLNPFATTLTTPSETQYQAYLNTSPELQMKKLLAQGFERIFNITKTFRNGEIGGGLHNPEFTMLEWYRTEAGYLDLMTDCENLITSLPTEQTTIDLSTPWPRKSVNQLFIEFTNIDLLENKTFEELQKAAAALDLSTEACQDWDDIFFKIFLNKIEPNLPKDRPIFVYDYPASQAALARKKPENDFWAERFELYIGGLEIANAFSELIDAKEQRTRLEEEQKLRKKLGKTVFHIDEEFLDSLESIQCPCAGIALGIDRLFMVLMGKKTIEEVLLFPLSNYIN